MVAKMRNVGEACTAAKAVDQLNGLVADARIRGAKVLVGGGAIADLTGTGMQDTAIANLTFARSR